MIIRQKKQGLISAIYLNTERNLPRDHRSSWSDDRSTSCKFITFVMRVSVSMINSLSTIKGCVILKTVSYNLNDAMFHVTEELTFLNFIFILSQVSF